MPAAKNHRRNKAQGVKIASTTITPQRSFKPELLATSFDDAFFAQHAINNGFVDNYPARMAEKKAAEEQAIADTAKVTEDSAQDVADAAKADATETAMTKERAEK
jgi:hypothetical protein